MDKLTALRYYLHTYRAEATQLGTGRIAREWMETMNFRTATREQLEQHAREAAEWANLGYLPGEAAPLIADGITPAMVAEMEQHAEQAAGGPEALRAQRIQQMFDTGQLVDPARVIRVQDPIDPTVEIVDLRDE